jgi:Domain of unknown function (DUF4328)
MDAYNPYLAPQNDLGPSRAYAPAWGDVRYTPLGWRTALAALTIAASAFFGLALDVTQMSVGNAVQGDSPDVVPALLVFFVAMAFLGSLVLSAIFFGIWIHRAARNLRALGRSGMKFSPAGCIGWYFVPFLNLVQPFKAMSELWRASEGDAESDGYGWWTMGTSTSMLGVWWGTWIVGNIISNISTRMDDASASGSVGLVGSGLIAVAAVTCILLMRGVSARQSSAASRLGVPLA